MTRFVLTFFCACAAAPAVFGQIIYENVRYQRVSADGQTYYYGGSEPRTHYWAEVQSALDAHCFNRHRYGAFSGGDRCLGDGRVSDRPRVYSDSLPYRNAARYGMTADDARNEAVRTAPLYFRKADLIRAGEVQPDGSIMVPSHPRMVIVVDRNARRPRGDGKTTKPATTGKILIIPKARPAKSANPSVASR